MSFHCNPKDLALEDRRHTPPDRDPAPDEEEADLQKQADYLEALLIEMARTSGALLEFVGPEGDALARKLHQQVNKANQEFASMKVSLEREYL